MSDAITEQEHSQATQVELAAIALAEKGHATIRCPNCTAPIIGPYCAVCGQERDTHRRSIWGLLGDLVEDIISFDSRILRTGVALMAEPGEIAMAFREGRPHRYVPALRLYFFVSLIFFLLLNVSGLAIMQFEVLATPEQVVQKGNDYYIVNPDAKTNPDEPKLIKINKQQAREPGPSFGFSARTHFFSPVGVYHAQLSPEARAKLLSYATRGKSGSQSANAGWIEKRMFGTINKLASDPAALNEFLITWLPRVLFLLLPLFALLLTIFYIRQRKNYYFVDHLIFSLNMHSFVFIALIVAVGVAQVFDSGWVALVACLAMVFYLFLAMKRFYQQGWIWTGIKFVLIGFIYTVFFLLPALGGAIAASVFWT